MNLSQILRVYRHYIAAVGLCRYETTRQTVYISSRLKPLLRQQQALTLLAHLEVAPAVESLERWRGLYLLVTTHPPCRGFLEEWQQSSKSHRVELVRRLGATLGMVHSLRDVRTGPIDNPGPLPPGKQIAAELKLYRAWDEQPSGVDKGAAAEQVWDCPGSALVGNWTGFPPLNVWDNGLIVMDFSRARFFDPLWDLVRLDPACLNWQDGARFWEYFLQGYCASGELPDNWRVKIALLAELSRLRELARGNGAAENSQNRWWEQL